MHKTPALLVLMAALAAGSAQAAGTLAGTTITNTATAEYPDPLNTSSTVSTPSNTVSTVVLPKPSFDVEYSDGTVDSGSQNTVAGTTVVTTGAVPGQSVSTNYTLVNTGNVQLDITLNADTTGSAPGATVKYYLYDAAAPGGLGTEIVAGSAVPVPADNPATVDDPATTTVVENDEGLVRIVQVVTLPTDPTLIDSTKVFGASPVGTVSGTQGADPLVTPGNGYATGTTAQEDAAAAGTDLQFVRVTVYAPNLDNNPNGTVTTPVDTLGQPIDTAVNPNAIPVVASVDVPTTPAGTANEPDPVVASTGYVTPGAPATDPTPGGTPIARVSGDEQVAYPMADADATADTVVFTNTITNTGGLDDKVQLFPALADGTPDPAYVYNATTGVFTNTATGVTVSFVDPVTGAVLKASTDPTNPTVAVYPTVIVPDGTTAVYRTVVTYPDSNDSAAIGGISVVIGADSLNDAGLVANSTTTDTILPPAAQFGDPATGQGADATLTPVQTVNPGGATGDGTSADVTDRTAAFPMDVVNNGQYNDSYTLSGSVTFTDAVTGADIVVPVLYYAADGVTLLPRLSTVPTSPDYNTFVTPVVAAGAEYQAVAVVQAPATALTAEYTVTQSATGSYSAITSTDTNNKISVTPTGNVTVAKFVAKSGTAAASETQNGIPNPTGYTAAPTGAQPQATIAYRIIAKNNYNTPVPLFIRDAVPANTELSSVALTPAPFKTIYRVGGNTGTWSATVPGVQPAGTVIDIAPDVDGDNLPDELAPGATLSVDYVVTVK